MGRYQKCNYDSALIIGIHMATSQSIMSKGMSDNNENEINWNN